MALIIELSNETLNRLNPQEYVRRRDLENATSVSDNSNFIYVPSISLYVAKERTLLGENWFDSQKVLHAQDEKMLTISEFREFLKYTRENNNDVYSEITEIRSPWRSEWLDADFKVQGKNLVVNYHVFENGKIVQKSEVLNRNTLMKDKTPGISLEKWIDNNHTSQGLPNKKISDGDLNYLYPISDDNSVAGFEADDGGHDLGCDRDPSGWFAVRGVRVAKQRKE